MHDLTGFQRDLLRAITILDRPKGLDVKAFLEADSYPHINHGRLYPNLTKLADIGLVNKGRIDDRTNSYTLTRRGKREVSEHYTKWGEAAENVENAY